MEMANFVDGLRNDLEAIAAVGDDPTADAARRLSMAIRASAGLRLLDALSEAALEVSGQLPFGHIEVRLSGQDAELVYVAEQEAEAAAPAGDDASARITLRLPEALKTSVEEAAGGVGAADRKPPDRIRSELSAMTAAAAQPYLAQTPVTDHERDGRLRPDTTSRTPSAETRESSGLRRS